MVPEGGLSAEFFAKLSELDERAARAIAELGCRHCGGRLHRGDYLRKPRGGEIGAAGEALRRRFSLCCSRAGCRKRTLPPSLRFLGRKVYLEAVVVWASVVAQLHGTLAAASRACGIATRTLRRWRAWWRGDVPQTAGWRTQRARLVPPPPDDRALPLSLVSRWLPAVRASTAAAEAEPALHACSLCLAPLTTPAAFAAACFSREG